MCGIGWVEWFVERCFGIRWSEIHSSVGYNGVDTAAIYMNEKMDEDDGAGAELNIEQSQN